MLLHPLDFLGSDDDLAPLAFFPAMRRPSAAKLAEVSGHLDLLAEHFRLVSLGEQAAALEARTDLAERVPNFRHDAAG